jgi:hypothetical protein
MGYDSETELPKVPWWAPLLCALLVIALMTLAEWL